MPRDARSSHRSEHTASPASRTVRAAGEVVLLGLVVASPWPFAAVDPTDEFRVALGVVALAALWAAHSLLTGRFTFRPDVVSLALAGLVTWTAFQLLPLPEGVVAVVSPGRADWHRTLVPAVEEVLPGEAAGVSRATSLPLTVDPSATRALVARLLGVLLVYAAARNWLADRDTLPRLLWALTAVGVGLAVLAVGQAATGRPNTGYWSIPLPATPYGSFINRNHYADFASLSAGAALGLALTRGEGGWLSAARFGPLLAAGFVLTTIPPSLSRGGTLAALGAGVGAWLLTRAGRAGRPDEWGRLALSAAAGVVLVAAATLGVAALQDRLAGLGERTELEVGRSAIWRDALRLVPRFPLAGTGGGTFGLVEPAVRADPGAPLVNYQYAHNEYVEALAEGGAVRLGLTLLLAGGLLLMVGRGAVARRERTVGGPLVGLWFGLAALVLHSAVEFGVHMPAVAVTAAAAAGYAVAASGDGGFVPRRVKFKRSRDGASRITEAPAEPPADDPDAGKWVGRGVTAWLAGGGVALAALLVAADSRGRARAANYERAAEAVARGRLPAADPTAQRAVYADACAAVRPDDQAGRMLAAEAHLQAAYEGTLAERAAMLGGAGAWAARAERVNPGPDVWAAVAHLRAARRVSPVVAKAHARLGLLADRFTGEPARVHFDRAKRLLPTDPEVWFAAGREAFARGDRPAALADWRRALELSGGRLPDVLATVRDLPLAAVRAELLPAEPAVSVAAADALFPDRFRQADDRRPFLLDAVRQAEAKEHPTGPDWAAAAVAAEELGRGELAADCWRKGVLAAPTSVPVRDGYARYLEREERWEEAMEQLKQLQRLAGAGSLQDRVEGCFHALKLKRVIGE